MQPPSSDVVVGRRPMQADWRRRRPVGSASTAVGHRWLRRPGRLRRRRCGAAPVVHSSKSAMNSRIALVARRAWSPARRIPVLVLVGDVVELVVGVALEPFEHARLLGLGELQRLDDVADDLPVARLARAGAQGTEGDHGESRRTRYDDGDSQGTEAKGRQPLRTAALALRQ